jgi:hypothetical protein
LRLTIDAFTRGALIVDDVVERSHAVEVLYFFGVNMPGQTAPHPASFLEELSIAFFVAESA